MKISNEEKKMILEMHESEKNKENIDENIFQNIADKWTGLKGIARGYGAGYFEGMSKLDRLIKKLKKLDEPNIKVMDELKTLKNSVQSYNIPQNRKDAIINLIDNSIIHFEKYNDINDQIIRQISLLNLGKWK
jgi:hypothetical protein